tara:strand:- start:325 stop:585 length:261 start_codon:yes stop_codon:yes gene_type:complete
MEKTIIISSMILFLLTSCGIDPCYCLKGYEGKFMSRNGYDTYKNSFTVKETQKCISEYGKDIPDSYRGTQQFTDAMISELRKKCKK